MSGQFWEIEASCQQIRHFPEYVEGPGRKGQWLEEEAAGRAQVRNEQGARSAFGGVSYDCFHCCLPPWSSILPAGNNGNSPFRKWIKQPEEKVRMGELRLVHPNSEFDLSYHPSSRSGQINRQAVPQTQNSYYFPMLGWESWKETVVGETYLKKIIPENK